ncbi:MAG: glycosyltransferase family 2 protein [Saprospirales bacterium]|nr:MAG: glycosyltransferase family 2 protein [Saprospirales bacterium]
MPKLSVAIITLNEEKNLARCLGSVAEIADEIIVVDSGSKDKTLEIAKDFGAKTFFNQWPGHVAQKNIALEKCTGEWILSLDADECLTPELAQKIKHIKQIEQTSAANGYYLNRKSYYLEKWMEYAWYPEWRVRLVKKGTGKWVGTDPHDNLRVIGKTAKIKGADFLHYSYRDLKHHMEVTINYARIGAQADLKKGKRFSPFKILFSPCARFFKLFFIKQAWMDGWRGWIAIVSSMMAAFLKQAFLFEALVKGNK